MAATASALASPWGKPGGWALAAEQEDDHAAAEAAADFPSLAAAAAAKPTKKKAQTISLAEFTTGKAITYGTAKPGDNVVLPSGPRERSAEEHERARFGCGFRGYGGHGGGEESRWGGGRGFGDEPSRGGVVERDLGPSRADEADDWGAGKRTAAPPPTRRRMFDSHSRADDSGSWGSNKGLAPSPSLPESRARRSGIDTFVGAADSAESLGRKKEAAVGGGRRRLVLQPRTAPLGNGEGSSNSNTKAKGANPFGEARPREEVLAENGQDCKKIDEELESMKIKETGGPSDGSAVGRKGFARAEPAEERTERSWRKPEVVEYVPRSDSEEDSRPMSCSVFKRVPCSHDLTYLSGEMDFLRPEGVKLVEAFVDACVIHHPKGHTIPRLDHKDEKMVMSFIDKIQDLCLTAPLDHLRLTTHQDEAIEKSDNVTISN